MDDDDNEEFFLNPKRPIHCMYALVNEEQLLQVALYVNNKIDDPEDPIRYTADSMITGYVVDELGRSGKSFTAEDVTKEFNSLVHSFIIDSMIKTGYIEEELNEDGEAMLRLSDDGVELHKDLIEKDED